MRAAGLAMRETYEVAFRLVNWPARESFAGSEVDSDCLEALYPDLLIYILGFLPALRS